MVKLLPGDRTDQVELRSRNTVDHPLKECIFIAPGDWRKIVTKDHYQLLARFLRYCECVRLAVSVDTLRIKYDLVPGTRVNARRRLISRMRRHKGESLSDKIRNIELEKITELCSHDRTYHPLSWGGFVALSHWR